ncbi:MAG: hypothetical protein EON95_18430 [Caulobacteraceae bacterium]|nr:MAG: hypothetical protein EON95_18430 [Caulobacteraceae bacterium]
MRRLAALLGLTVLALATPSIAAPPKAISDTVNALVAERAVEGWTPEEAADPANVPARLKIAPPAMFKQVDVNGDRLADWQVSFEKAPNPSMFCGTGGCKIQLYASQADGSYRLVFDSLFREFALKGPKSGRYVDVDFHGSACGGYGVTPCPRRYGWDAALGRFVERPDSEGRTLLVFGSRNPVETPLNAAPPEIAAQVARRDSLCRAAGGTFATNEADYADLPDLNGDGRRDWIVGTWDSCNFEGDIPDDAPLLPTTVLVTGPGGLTPALEGVFTWQIDIARSPARFDTIERNDDCSTEDATCKITPMAWDAASRTLVPAK